MTDIKQLGKKVSMPAVTDDKVIEKAFIRFLKMDTDMLYHRSLLVKDTNIPYCEHCIRQIRRLMDIKKEDSKTVYELFSQLSKDISYSYRCEDDDNCKGWYNKYLDTMTYIARIYTKFNLTRSLKERRDTP